MPLIGLLIIHNVSSCFFLVGGPSHIEAYQGIETIIWKLRKPKDFLDVGRKNKQQICCPWDRNFCCESSFIKLLSLEVSKYTPFAIRGLKKSNYCNKYRQVQVQKRKINDGEGAHTWSLGIWLLDEPGDFNGCLASWQPKFHFPKSCDRTWHDFITAAGTTSDMCIIVHLIIQILSYRHRKELCPHGVLLRVSRL